MYKNPDSREGAGGSVVIDRTGAAVIAVLLLLAGGYLYFSEIALDCSGDGGCHPAPVLTRPINCNEWYAHQPRSQLHCDRTRKNLSSVAMVGDAANYILSSRSGAEPQVSYVQDPEKTLANPWDMEFLPGGDALITTQPGNLVRYNGSLQVVESLEPHFQKGGTFGLLGLAVHPDFEENRYIYLYYTTGFDTALNRYGSFHNQDNNFILNRVSRFRLTDDGLRNETVLLDDLPGSIYHAGGRLEFGPDGNLYVTTGDGDRFWAAANTSFLGGKILRINPDGTIPEDNPFAESPVYAAGFKNPQGMAWQPSTGAMFATEHGPWRHDEINRVQAGGDYGWPVRKCTTDDMSDLRRILQEEYGQNTSFEEGVRRLAGEIGYNGSLDRSRDGISPAWCAREWTLAPTAATFVDEPGHSWHGDLFVAGLRGKHLHRFDVSGGEVTGSEIFWITTDRDDLSQRLRDVEQYNGSLWVLGDYHGLAELSPS
ncbi:MAG: sorbosone dehydrogenase family protein [Candidatus Nanohaloarchaea archaeon]